MADVKTGLAIALIALGIPACTAVVGAEDAETGAQPAAPRAQSVEELRSICGALLDEVRTNPELQKRLTTEPERLLASRGIDATYIDDAARYFAALPSPDCANTCGNTCAQTCNVTCSETNPTCNKTCVHSTIQ